MTGKKQAPHSELSAHARQVALITIHRYFEDLPDTRVRGRSKYPLITLIVLVLLATICGCDGWDQIEVFVDERQDWLREFIDLPDGELPSDDTFRRVIGAIDPVAFRTCLLAWLTALVGTHVRPHVAIDGKTARRSFDRASGTSAMHMVEAWVVNGHVLIGQVATDDKSNEIPAVAQLLEQFKLEGSVVTMDAMGTQRAHVEKIRAGGGDYILAVKDNQPSLRQMVEAHIEKSLDTGHSRDGGDVARPQDRPNCARVGAAA